MFKRKQREVVKSEDVGLHSGSATYEGCDIVEVT